MGTWPFQSPDGSPEASATSQPVEVLAGGALTDWEARWDSTGTRLAVWIADRQPSGAGTGKLTLYRVDAGSGRLDRSRVLLDSVAAMDGFSIASGRLVWQSTAADGKANIEVLAWTDKDVGQVELSTVDEPLVIVR
jgi:hypothetical protein